MARAAGSRAQRYQGQAQAAAVAASRVQAASVQAAAEEQISEVTGGGSDTIAELRTELESVKQRLDDGGIP